MESFYGGRKGISFIISKRFDGIDIPENTIRTGDYYATDVNGKFLIKSNAPIVRTPENQNDPAYIWKYHLHDGSEVQKGSKIYFKDEWAKGMVQFFKKGAETVSEVGYGEYVIIDTIGGLHNFNNLENGIVYRRGMDYQQEIKDDFKAPGAGAEYVGQIIGPQGEVPIVNMDTISNIKTDGNFNNANSGMGNCELVSGKDSDHIQYAWVEMLDVFGNNIGVKLGFTFPYTFFNFTAKRTNAYTDPKFTRLTAEDGGRPFYYEWEVSIPEGVHGIDNDNFRIENAKDGKGDALWYTKTDYTDETPQVTNIQIAPYKVIDEVSLANDGTFKVDYTYDNHLVLEKVIRWIKKNNDTNGIDLADNGTITINYNTGEEVVYEKAFTWITDASLAENGNFQVLFNNDNIKKINKTIKWVNSIGIDSEGTVTYYYNDNTTEIFNHVLTWITDVSLSDEGKFKVRFNNNDTVQNIDKTIKWVNTIGIAEDGTVTYYYNDNTTDIFNNVLNWVTDSSLEENGNFKMSFNNENIKDIERVIRWIQKNNDTNGIDLADNGTITVSYNTGEVIKYEEALTWITDVSLANNGEFQVLFNNSKPSFNKTIKWVDSIDINIDGTVTYYYNDNTTEIFNHVLTWITDVSLSDKGEFKVDFNNNSTIQNINKTIKWINTIGIDENGTITYYYNDDTTEVFDNTLTWVTDSSLTDDGKFQMSFNNDKIDKIEKVIRWIKKNNDTNGIDLANNGTITINYNTGEVVNYEEALTWITDASLADDGTFQIVFNNSKQNFNKTIKWVNSINIDENGTVTYYYNDNTTEIFNNVLTWITDVSLADNGEFKVEFNNNETIQNVNKTIKWVKSIGIDEDGTVNYYYNDDTVSSINNALTWITDISLGDNGEFKVDFNNNNTVQNFSKAIKWIGRVELDEDGTITYYYSTGEVALKKDKFSKVIKNIDINTGNIEGEGSQKVVVTYNTGEVEEIGNGLNYIIETIVTDGNSAIQYGAQPFHLLVLYADPEKRGQVSYPSKVFGEVRNDWKDLGYIRGEVGALRVIGNFETEDNLKNADGGWLTPPEVEGYNDERIGWGYTIEEKFFYLYDYNKKIWYNVGAITVNPKNVITISSDISEAEKIYDGGFWFVLEKNDSVN